MAKRDELSIDAFTYALKLSNDSGIWAGKVMEQERIIKLLENEIQKIQIKIDEAEDDPMSIGFWNEDISKLNDYIAVIREEI